MKMNFAISGQKRFGLPTGVLGSRQFGTSCKFDIIPRANRFLSHAIINPTKAFENPNFVNKDHPKFFSWASILRIGRQQDSSDCEDDASQPDPEPKSSPASKKYKKSRKRNKKSKRSHTKKTPKRTNKPWHKTKDDEMDLIADFDMTNDTESPTTKSPPVDIEKSVSISPCCRCLSVSSDNSASSSSSSKRLRIASECDSEDSFIIFTEECTEEDTEDSNDDSDFTNETDDDAGDDDIEFDVNFKGCDITNKNKKVSYGLGFAFSYDF